MKNVVDPYMTMRSPGRPTSTLSASAHASHVPAATGVPAGMPVSAAAWAVTVPTRSEGHTSRGIGTPGATSAQRSSIQAPACRS